MKRGTPDHPKMKALARRLRINVAWACGIMERLWQFTAEFAQPGDIGRFSDAAIAEAAAWPEKRADELIEALTADECHWLDWDIDGCRLLVHDWPDHCEDGVHKWLARRRLFFACGRTPNLARLSGKEKSEAEEWYKTHPRAPRVRPECAQSADMDAQRKPSLSQGQGLCLSQGQSPSQRGAPVRPITSSQQASERFEEWWEVWSSVRGTENRTQACTAWVSVVTPDLERDCFACTESYLQSAKVRDGGGYNPENFLFAQAKDKFTARWPTWQPPRKGRSLVEEMAHL